MSNPYGPTPESLEDWNTILENCCCGMPECPAPELESERKRQVFDLCLPTGREHCWPFKTHTDRRYHSGTHVVTSRITVDYDIDVSRIRTNVEVVDPPGCSVTCTTTVAAGSKTTTTTEHGPGADAVREIITETITVGPDQGTSACKWTVTTRTEEWEITWDGSGDPVQGAKIVDSTTASDTSTFPTYNPHAHTQEESWVLVTDDDIYTAAIDYVNTLSWASGVSSAEHAPPLKADNDGPAPGCTSGDYTDSWPTSILRYRWEVPDSFEGTWFRIDWDEVFVPDARDPDQTKVFSEKSWEWSDPDSKTSPWSATVTPPSGRIGVVEIANVRYKCYDGPYGSLPQFDDSYPTHDAPA